MHKTKIMVVDDEAVIATQLEERLKRGGYEVVGKAFSGREALEMARCLRPDLILMDIVMPGKLDGIDASERIKAELDIPIIFLTAYADNKFIKRAKNVEPSAYILKPFQENEIEVAIEVALYKKNMERRLRESEEKYRSVVDNAHDAIVSVNSRGDIIFWNQRAETIFGYSAHEAISKPFTLIIPERFRKAYQKEVNQITSRKKPNIIGKTVEATGLRKDGSEFPLEISLGIWNTGEKLFLTGIIRDLTERKRLEKQAIHIEKLASTAEVAAGVAHEVRNPLSIIFASAQYLQKALGPEDPYQEYIEAIIKNVQTVETFISELLNFAHPLPISLEVKDIHQCLDRSLRFLRRKFFEQKVQLIKEYQEGLPLVMLDEQHIGQVFLNLALNAIQAMPQGGKLTINTKYYPKRKEIIVKFKDTGPGIPKENMAKIFTPFFSTWPKGIGLGLSMSQKIVEMHGGSLTAESTMGQGATFVITLPCHES